MCGLACALIIVMILIKSVVLFMIQVNINLIVWENGKARHRIYLLFIFLNNSQQSVICRRLHADVAYIFGS